MNVFLERANDIARKIPSIYSKEKKRQMKLEILKNIKAACRTKV